MITHTPLSVNLEKEKLLKLYKVFVWIEATKIKIRWKDRQIDEELSTLIGTRCSCCVKYMDRDSSIIVYYAI